MHQRPLSLRVIHPIIRPLQYVIPIPTLMLTAKVRPGIGVILQPLPRDETYVGAALER
jgi:hypothetical protein